MEIIDKIFTEKKIIKNNYFTIVFDKYPLCHDHLLAFSTLRLNASLCHKSSELIALMEDVQNYYNEPFYFYERGNACFCTSISGPICTHIHFFPKKFFKTSTFANLVNLIEPNVISSFDEITYTQSEYFLFGDDDYTYYKRLIQKPEKRFMRNYFKGQLL